MFPTTHTHTRRQSRGCFWSASGRVQFRSVRLEVVVNQRLEPPKLTISQRLCIFFFKEQINQNTRVVQKTKQERKKKSHKLHKSDPNYSNVPFLCQNEPI